MGRKKQSAFDIYLSKYAKQNGVTKKQAAKHKIPMLVKEWYELREKENVNL